MIFLEALKGKISKVPPLWIMRQAGRYLPEYRALRAKVPAFMDFCSNAELAAQVTLQPIERFDLDAAIIFSDILMIPHALGQKVSFVEGAGPVLDPLEDMSTLSSSIDPDKIKPTLEALTHVRRILAPSKALIGFAGGPWTVLTYMIEGQGSKGKGHAKTLKVALNNPTFFEALLKRVTQATIDYLCAQIEAGADVVKIFESWAGSIPASLQERLLFKPLEEIATALRQKHPQIPLIVFPKGVCLQSLQEILTRVNPQALAIDAGHDPRTLAHSFSPNVCLQTGPDPAYLVAGGAPLREIAQRYRHAFEGRPYIFNLAHGITPDTPIDHVHILIEEVRRQKPAAYS